MNTIHWTVAAAGLVALLGCGERPQEMGSGAKPDAPAYQGTGVAAFTAPGWKAGDANSWAQELRTRGQYGQNEYPRTQTK